MRTNLHNFRLDFVKAAIEPYSEDIHPCLNDFGYQLCKVSQWDLNGDWFNLFKMIPQSSRFIHKELGPMVIEIDYCQNEINMICHYPDKNVVHADSVPYHEGMTVKELADHIIKHLQFVLPYEQSVEYVRHQEFLVHDAKNTEEPF